jgi:hypothetical protein
MNINFNEYVEACSLFANKDCKDKLAHYLLGIGSEIGEIGSCIKKEIGYGKELDIVNLGEEIGDLFWFIGQYIKEYTKLFTNDPTVKLTSHFNIQNDFHKKLEEFVIEGNYNPNIIGAYNLWGYMVEASSQLINKPNEHYILKLKSVKLIRDYAYILARMYDLDLDKILHTNIQKLTNRYGGKVFDQNKALFRNLGVEYTVLKDNL